MSGDGVNKQRRYFLIGATSVVGGLGVVGAAVPFVRSWSPSAKARALGAPVTVDFSRLNPGEMLGPIPAWRGQPVFILYRTPEALETLSKLDASRADPDFRARSATEVREERMAFAASRDRCLHRPVYAPRLFA